MAFEFSSTVTLILIQFKQIFMLLYNLIRNLKEINCFKKCRYKLVGKNISYSNRDVFKTVCVCVCARAHVCVCV